MYLEYVRCTIVHDRVLHELAKETVAIKVQDARCRICRETQERKQEKTKK